ncbi:MAG: carboxylesterase family protein [Pseudomonadota bacterium]
MKILLITIVILALIGAGLWWFFGRKTGMQQLEALRLGKHKLTEWVGTETITIDTRLGKVTGLSNGRVLTFLGLRYAEPPTGERRFLQPVAAGGWEGAYKATALPKVPMQVGSHLNGEDESTMDEDSLFMNIFTPSTEGSHRPVLFWIHGGSYIEGSANGYDGTVLAEQGDVVVVAINYRLGMAGFLDLSQLGDAFAGSASNGIRDQILALEWVRDNIADYGGDPGNVMIFGESAGGGSVLSILSSPSADGLYHKAISHSGPGPSMPPQDFSEQLIKHLGVEPADLLSALRALSAEELIAVQRKISFGGGGAIDGTVLTRSSNDAILDRGAAGVPLIAGNNLDEGTLFSFVIPWFAYGLVGDAVAQIVVQGEDTAEYLAALKTSYPEDGRTERFERIWDHMFRRSAIHAAERATTAGPGGWLYRFDLPVQVRLGKTKMGATHGAEIAFTFNTFASDAPDSVFLYDRRDPVVRELAQNWSNTVIAFAKTGNPNGAGLPAWPQYSAETRQTLILDAEPRLEAFLDTKERKLWGDE